MSEADGPCGCCGEPGFNCPNDEDEACCLICYERQGATHP